MDLPGAFQNMESDKFVVMLLPGNLAEPMVQPDAEICRKFVITSSRGEPILCVKLIKALYGLSKSTLLFYK